MVGESHRDEGDATDEVADVEEEEASEKGEGGPEQPGRLLAGPQTPQGGGEVSDCVHPHHLLLTGRRRARWPPHRQLSQAAVLLRPAAALRALVYALPNNQDYLISSNQLRTVVNP